MPSWSTFIFTSLLSIIPLYTSAYICFSHRMIYPVDQSRSCVWPTEHRSMPEVISSLKQWCKSVSTWSPLVNHIGREQQLVRDKQKRILKAEQMVCRSIITSCTNNEARNQRSINDKEERWNRGERSACCRTSRQTTPPNGKENTLGDILENCM